MSIASESELERRDMKDHMTYEQRMALTEQKEQRKKFY